jgi:hypothetical protein
LAGPVDQSVKPGQKKIISLVHHFLEAILQSSPPFFQI